MPINPGVYTDLSIEDYHADPALGHSGMVQLLKSGLHYHTWASRANEPTEAMEIGTATHLALLEPDLFNVWVTVQPETIKVRRGKVWDEFLGENPGKTILRRADWDYLLGMIESIERPQHTTARQLLRAKGRIIEQSIFWDHHGVMLKCRPDVTISDIGLIDLKSCTDASADGFGRAAARYGYDIQAALYLNGANQAEPDAQYRDFIFVAIEKDLPHAIGVRTAPYEMLDAGRVKIRTAIERFQKYQAAGQWAGYPDQPEELIWPRWAV